MDLMSMSEQDFLRALTLAKQDNNQEAVAQVRQLYTAWMSAKDRAQNDPTAGMSLPQRIGANFGAGVMNVWEGGKQALGLSAPGEISEKAVRDQTLAKTLTGGSALQGVGTAAALVPAAFVPGANTALGAGLVGGAVGALMPTEMENVLAGKALNIGTGVVGGAAMQKGLQMAGNYAPRAYNAAADWWARHGLPGASPARQASIGERAFTQALPDPQQARLRLMQFQERIPGVRTSTAAALDDPALLAAERAARETAGRASDVLRQQEVANNAARWNYIKEIGGDVSAAKRAAWDWFEEAAAKLKPKGVIDPKGRLVQEVDRLIDQHGAVSKAANTALSDLREALANALLANNGKGDIGQLHKVRMYVIDDKLKALESSDSKLAGALRTVIGGKNGIKSQLDDALNAATSGRWSKLLQGFAERRQVASQREAANELVGKMSVRATSRTGEPMVTSSMTTLRKEALNPPNRYGQPTYGPQDASRVSTTLADAERQLAPFKPGVSPKGSATTANFLERGPGDLMRYLRPSPQVEGGNLAAATAGGLVTGEPKGAVVGWLGNQARLFAGERSASAKDAIAGRIAELLADQAEAYRLLETLNPVLRAKVLEHWTKRIPLNVAPPLGGLLGQQAAEFVR